MHVRTWRPALVLILLILATGTAHAQFEDQVHFGEGYVIPKPLPIAPMTTWTSPGVHRGLAISFVTLQALDVITTVAGTRTGRAVEANPFVMGLSDKPVAYAGVKSGLTVGTLAAMHRLAAHRPKTAALAMIGLNAAYAWVVAANVRAASVP